MSSGGASVGIRNDSLAHAPRSNCLHRSQQNGRYAFWGAYTLSPPHWGQTTIFGLGSLVEGRLVIAGIGGSGAEGQFEGAVGAAGVQAVIISVLHQPNRYHETVAADFGNDFLAGVECQAQ
jgi:hypothetical protein